jgi:hypothetical protein
MGVRMSLGGMVWIMLVLCGVGSALGFYATSTALEAEPPAKTFEGWIGVLVPKADIASEVQVRVSALALSHGERPRMAYGATACGGGSFSGYLLIGGNARLDPATLQAPPRDAQMLPPGDIEVTNEADGSVTQYRDVQVVQVSLRNLPRCIGSVANDGFAGVGFRIEGEAASPVSTSAGGLLRAAVQRWSMPLVGSFPSAGIQAGVFRIDGAIRGEFVRPIPLGAAVDAGPIPLRLDLSDSRPATDSVNRANWYLPQPFQATAKVRDASYQSTLQNWNAFCAIALGVFGSIVASMLFEWARSRVRTTTVAANPTTNLKMAGAAHPQGVAPSRQRPRSALAPWAGASLAALGYLVGRLCRQRAAHGRRRVDGSRP